MLQRLVYSKFAIANVGAAKLDEAALEAYPTVPESQFRWSILFSEQACQAVVEDWFKDNDLEWTYWIDSIFYVLSGECEVTLWQPPNWIEKRIVVAKPGDIFLCPRGARAKFRVVSDEVFRHIVLDVPNAGYDAEELAAGTADRAAEAVS
jgi:mannose-6-phosphate isomerase-like protein (cupin superfamily)